MFLDIDFVGIWTRNLLIWSPTRYRYHTMSCKQASRTVKISGFLSFRYSFFWVTNMSIFPWNDVVLLETKKIPIKLTGPFLNFLKKVHNF